MQKTQKNSHDFFSLYRTSEFKKHIFSASIAIFTAFSFVGVYHWDVDMSGLMASVSNVVEAPKLEADIIMSHESNMLSIVFGTKAEKVDQIEFTLLGDPSRLRSLVSTSANIQISSQPDMGAYRVVIQTNGQDLSPSQKIADLKIDMDRDTPVALTDTVFVSGWQRYNLTNKVQ